eukprot:TRINITY_DN105569_c0_g1_i1.p1 TRINITY_DN105569_c0_g1~~TRINITY_DN105569_c0_g1_i1.p1  ORF type:complete len:418 (+),score=59.17 TRINITY_DN105569_c0_g1_i1:191-1444(+)
MELSTQTYTGLAASCLIVALVFQDVKWMQPKTNRCALFALAAIWFWASALWAAVTKDIQMQLSGSSLYPSTSIWLTFLPQVFSCFCVQLFAMMGGTSLVEGTVVPTRAGESWILGSWQLAGAGVFFGQLFTVESLNLNSPGVVFAVKAIEPLSTAVLAIPVLKQRFNMQLVMAIIVTCMGISVTAYAGASSAGSLASASGRSATHVAVALAMLANVGYSAKSCVVKKELGNQDTYPLESYGKITITATQSGVVLVMLWTGIGLRLLHPVAFHNILLELHLRPMAWLVACMTYFLYQAASVLLLDCMLVETHSLLVALKQVFVVVLASVMTHHAINASMINGLITVCAGVCWYAQSQNSNSSIESGAEDSREPAVPEDSPLLPISKKLQDDASKLPSVLCGVIAIVVIAGSLTPLFHL